MWKKVYHQRKRLRSSLDSPRCSESGEEGGEGEGEGRNEQCVKGFIVDMSGVILL